jgi:hypothetical protein
MFNFSKNNKSDSLNDNLRELEYRFQERIDEQDKSYKLHIQKLDEKIVVLEEKHKITYELMDKLYDYRFQEINNNTAKLSTQMSCKLNQCISVYDNKLGNTFTTLQEGMQNITNQIHILNNNQNEIMIEIQKLKNNTGNNFKEQINTLTKQQEITNEKLVVLNNNVSELDYKIDRDLSYIEDKIDRIEEETQEKIDKKIDEADFSIKLKIITDDVSEIETHLSDVEKNMIISINEETQTIRGVINCLSNEIHQIEIDQISNPNINTDTSIITDKLEICMNAIKKINVYQIPLSGTMTRTQLEQYNALNISLGTPIIVLDEAYEFSYINQFYNLKVLVINNWPLFNYGIFDPNNRNTEAGNFKKMGDRYGEMNNKTLETFIIHTLFDFKTWNNPYDPGTATRREPLMLEYLCMQFKNFSSLKIVKLYYLDLPENIEDILINNLKLTRHAIKELHIITNTNLKLSKLRNYCNNHNIMFINPDFYDFILSKDPHPKGKTFSTAYQLDVIVPLKQQLMMEDESYMRRHKPL